MHNIHSKYILVLIIAFALFLRLTGINWGLQDQQNIPRHSTHFDENFSVNCCKQIDLEKLDINPESGQIDGSLMYYLWNSNAFILKAIGLLNKTPNQIISIDQDYSDFIFYSRLLLVFFDIFSLILIYSIVRKITGNITASLLAAFIFAIIPFEIMHSIYMRPHIALNTFLLLVIYFSLFIYERENIGLFVKLGLILGLCTAMRYTCVINVLIPVLFFYNRRISSLKQKTFYTIISIVFNKRLLIMMLFLFVGLAAGNPSWIFDFNSIMNGIILQNQMSNSFNPADLSQLSRISNYILWIIPAGTFYLWLLFYPAYIYSFFIKKYLKYIIPLSIYILIYFVPMALGYPILVIRVVLPLFPIFTIISGILISDILFRFAAKKTILNIIILFSGFILISVSIFSFSLVKAMSNKNNDPYVQLSEYFQDVPQKRNMKIVVIAPTTENYILLNLYYIFKAIPGKNIKMYDGNNEEYFPFKTYKLIVDYNIPKTDSVDYVVFGNLDYSTNDYIKRGIDTLIKTNDFVFEKQCKNEIHFKNIFYDYTKDTPCDFRYPFQIFYILKRHMN